MEIKNFNKLKFIIFYFSLVIFFLLGAISKVFAVTYTLDCDMPMSSCQAAKGSPQNKCCQSSGGCDTVCGHINQWDWCHAAKCCGYYSDACPIGSWYCYTHIYYFYTYTSCGAQDCCVSGNQLNAGICGSDTCIKGGVYKICCTYPWNGTRCSHSCSGSNFTGTCGPGCLSPGPGVMTCPGGGSSPTHKVCSGTSCVTVSGSGSNECSLNADCGGSGPTPTPGGGSCAIISAYKGACPVGYVNSGGCPLGQRRQARTVTPSGCATTLNGVI